MSSVGRCRTVYDMVICGVYTCITLLRITLTLTLLLRFYKPTSDLFGSIYIDRLEERTSYDIWAMTTNTKDDRCSRLFQVDTVETLKEPLPPLSKKVFEGPQWLRSALKNMLHNAVEELSLVYKEMSDEQCTSVAAYLKDNESVKVRTP